MKYILLLMVTILLAFNPVSAQEDVFDKVEHHYANNEGVKIHYVSMGEGPVLIMLHGFPDFWYTWRYQMAELSNDYKVVAVDLRGYNKSDKPKGVSKYSMSLLMKDVVAVIDDLKLKKATIIANDWGGAIAWQLATYYPNRVERLIACNIPHPSAIASYLNSNPRTGQYAQNYKKEGAEKTLTAESLTGIHNDLSDIDRRRYIEAFKRSSFSGMLNYYRASYPSASKTAKTGGDSSPVRVRKVKSPVLLIHGALDTALPVGMLNNTWDWVDNEVTIYTIPDAGHFVQQAAPKKVNRMIKIWLEQ